MGRGARGVCCSLTRRRVDRGFAGGACPVGAETKGCHNGGSQPVFEDTKLGLSFALNRGQF